MGIAINMPIPSHTAEIKKFRYMLPPTVGVLSVIP
jgi:hypothetical protein